MLTQLEMKCLNCGDDDSTEVEMTADRGGRLVRFRVDCTKCGTFSHYIDEPMLAHAAKEFLHKAPTVMVLNLKDPHFSTYRAADFAKKYPELVERVDRLVLGEFLYVGNLCVAKVTRESIS